jgi:hydroxypyruvate isomerase
MNRREFNQALAGTVIGGCGVARGAGVLSQASAPAAQSDQAAQAPFEISIMLWTVFEHLRFEQRLEKVAEAGYRNVELVGEYAKWSDADFGRANAKRKELGIKFDCTAGLKFGVSDPEDREPLLAELRRALPIMERIECPTMIVLSGNRVAGMAREMQHQSCVESLKAASKVVEGKSIDGKPVRLLLETIDPKENPKYYLTQISEALQVVDEVAHPQVELLYDFYHEQISAGNLIEKILKSLHKLALVHIADVPGRHEPGTGEINYENIFRKLGELNYKGMVAMEFLPSGDPVEKLRAAREAALGAGAEGARSKNKGS